MAFSLFVVMRRSIPFIRRTLGKNYYQLRDSEQSLPTIESDSSQSPTCASRKRSRPRTFIRVFLGERPEATIVRHASSQRAPWRRSARQLRGDRPRHFRYAVTQRSRRAESWVDLGISRAGCPHPPGAGTKPLERIFLI